MQTCLETISFFLSFFFFFFFFFAKIVFLVDSGKAPKSSLSWLKIFWKKCFEVYKISHQSAVELQELRLRLLFKGIQ